jgi:ATP phosphoribosyltransferase
MNGLTLAIPSKGRLEEQTREAFAAAGVAIERAGGARAYFGSADGLPELTVRFMPAAEIARELVRGGVELGVTGADLIEETTEASAEVVRSVHPLGFGRADVVVAVPDPWIDVTRMTDLADVAADFRPRHRRWLRIATKYSNLTRRFFARHGMVEYRIVESTGATEAAPAAGAADLIVDITTTGSTLSANALRVLEDGLIFNSEAHLFASRRAGWTAESRAQLDEALGRLGWGAAGLSQGL